MERPSLESSLDPKDPGDEILSRYRYQLTYAAVISLELLQDPPVAEAILCEQWEDILVRKAKDRYWALQVKTRDASLGPFESGHDSIVKSLARFVLLEAKHPGLIERYQIVSNAGFLRGGKTSKFLPHLLDLASSKQSPPSKGILHTYLGKVCKKAREIDSSATVTEDIALSVLQRTKLKKSEDIPSLRRSLACALATTHKELADASLPTLEEAADALVMVALKAASRHDRDMTEHFLLDDIEEVEEVIESKTIDKAGLLVALAKHVEAGGLVAATPVLLPATYSGLERKLSLGGLGGATIAAARDWQASMIWLQRKWASKYGETKASEYYQHLQTLARTECSTSFEHKYKKSQPFGRDMYLDVRPRLEARLSDIPARYRGDCKVEHLLGCASLLTEQCEVWWSDEVDLAEPDA